MLPIFKGGMRTEAQKNSGVMTFFRLDLDDTIDEEN